MINKLIVVLIANIFTSMAVYADTGAVGNRIGAATVHEGVQYEFYGRYVPTKNIMSEISLGYGKLDYVINDISMTKIEQMPLTVVLAARLPLDIVSTYAGGGASLIFVDMKKTFVSPIVQAELEFPTSSTWYISADYRHQFNQATNFWFGGVGVRF